MNRMLTASAALALIATGALAQQQGMPAQLIPAAQATRMERGPAAARPALNWSQAKALLEANGYSDVRGLSQDASGTWRARAVKDGKPSNVSLTAAGNVPGR